MRVLPAVAIGLAVGAVIAAPQAKDKPDAKDDLKKLAGDWAVVSYQLGGAEFVNTPQFQGAVWSFAGGKYTLQNGAFTEEGTVKLDQAKKVPTIDLDISAGPDRGKEQIGVYQLDGDTLVFSLALPGATDRPTELTSPPGSRNLLVTMKRKK